MEMDDPMEIDEPLAVSAIIERTPDKLHLP